MSTLKATNLSHASAASPNIVLDSAGKVTFGGAVAGAGMDLITPTSVAGTGVTVSGGQVSFTAATSVSVNGCFTATYDNYFAIIYMTTAATGAVSMRLRTAGTDASGANYNQQRMGAQGTTAILIRTTSATSWFGQSPVAGLMPFNITFFRPAIADTTSALVLAGRETNTTIDIDTFALGHTLATAYDGFTFAPGSAATGKLRVYGLRNS